MTPRLKKIVFAVVGAYVAAMIVWLIVFKGFVDPASRLAVQKVNLVTDINRLSDQNRLAPGYDRQYRQLAAQMLPGSEAQASGYLAATIMTLLDCSHLTGKLRSSQPLQPKPASGFKEIGHSIRVKGRIENLVDLLYLLQAQPFLHRLDNLTLNRDVSSGEFDLAFHYCALVVDPAKNKRVRTTQPATDAAPIQDLDTPQRRQYDAIAARDLFRPYVKRIVEPPPPPQAVTAYQPPPSPPPTARQEFQVCGLITWRDGVQEVAVRNSSNGEVRCYKRGDKLEGGEIVMIDYRPMPKPDNPKLESPSRVILKIGQDYWAVELEKSLSDKRLLKSGQLPPELLPPPASAPGEAKDKGPEVREATLTLQ